MARLKRFSLLTFYLISYFLSTSPVSCEEKEAMSKSLKFPDGFLFGAGTSSYQVEGAWNEDGKGESIIDNYIKKNPSWAIDSSNGDIACDSYHHWDIDIQLLKDLGVNFYRFSISWPRIFPTGDPTVLNKKGIDYYDKLINGLLESGIEPVVTIYHWDLPQKLQDLGGWTNRVIIDYFEEFCRTLFSKFGERVKWWVTLNEPQLLSLFGYGQWDPKSPVHPPGVKLPGIADYLAVHNLLLSHARVYHMYRKEFEKQQKGKLGIAVNIFGGRPASDKQEDIEAVERHFIFEAGWILHPLLSSTGNYHPLFIERVDKNSQKEGRLKSRLPKFTHDEIESLKGAIDYIGINYYTTFIVKSEEIGASPSFDRDRGVKLTTNPEVKVPGVFWLGHDPEGFRSTLNWVKKNYGNRPIFITENGCDDLNGSNDTVRITYHKEHLKSIWKAIHEDGCNIIGYTIWSLMDSFEWSSGYTAKFGLYNVDFSDPKRKRTPKMSVKFFQNLHKYREIES